MISSSTVNCGQFHQHSKRSFFAKKIQKQILSTEKEEGSPLPWSSGERRGLTVRVMVLGHGFEIWLRLKTRWKDGPFDGRKITKIIKTANWVKSQQKKNTLRTEKLQVRLL